MRLGADAFAVAIFVRGQTEAQHIRMLADLVRQAEHYEMPVVCHTYPRDFTGSTRVSFKPEDIAWAVRSALEAGADVDQTPYCGEVRGVSTRSWLTARVPLVAAGGPKAETLDAGIGDDQRDHC